MRLLNAYLETMSAKTSRLIFRLIEHHLNRLSELCQNTRLQPPLVLRIIARRILLVFRLAGSRLAGQRLHAGAVRTVCSTLRRPGAVRFLFVDGWRLAERATERVDESAEEDDTDEVLEEVERVVYAGEQVEQAAEQEERRDSQVEDVVRQLDEAGIVEDKGDRRDEARLGCTAAGTADTDIAFKTIAQWTLAWQ